MKKTLLLLLLFPFTLMAQEPLCMQKVQGISTDSLVHFVRVLSGRDSAIINGAKTRIPSRYKYHPGNELAFKYITETCLQYGLQLDSQVYSSTGKNLIAWKPGHTNPNKAVMLVAHYDGVGFTTLDFQAADDNGSGTAALLETARLFQDTSLPYTILLGFFDEEEAGLVGSKVFVESGMLNFELLGAINLDMIAYDGDNDSLINIHVKAISQSEAFGDKVLEARRKYNIGLQPRVISPGSNSTDHKSFWDYNKTAIGLTEDYDNGFNPNWHQFGDSIETFNLPYFHKMTQLALATICETGATGVVAGIKKQVSEMELLVYPNPTSGLLEVVTPLEMNAAGYTLTDMNGKMLQEGILEAGVNRLSLPSGLQQGVYFLSIHAGNSVYNQKVVLSF